MTAGGSRGGEEPPGESARVDRWLWAVRLFRTRTAASEACRGGHVRLNGSPAKAAAPVRPGDRVVLRGPGRERLVEVVRPIDRRVGAAEAADCLVDHTPPSTRSRQPSPFARDPATGRPTKRDRRRMDRLRGR